MRVQSYVTSEGHPSARLSSAIKIFQGRFGRVALLDMDASLVGHAHPHCHIVGIGAGVKSSIAHAMIIAVSICHSWKRPS